MSIYVKNLYCCWLGVTSVYIAFLFQSHTDSGSIFFVAILVGMCGDDSAEMIIFNILEAGPWMSYMYSYTCMNMQLHLMTMWSWLWYHSMFADSAQYSIDYMIINHVFLSSNVISKTLLACWICRSIVLNLMTLTLLH